MPDVTSPDGSGRYGKRRNLTPGGPHYNVVQRAWLRLSHDRRALIAIAVLFVAGVVASAVAFYSRSDIVEQPPSPCWPTITASPTEVHAGDPLTVTSTGFKCGYLANDGKPVAYWLVLSGATAGTESFRFGPIQPQQSGAFGFSLTLSPTMATGQWSVVVEGHQHYTPPEGCAICTPPDISPVVRVV